MVARQLGSILGDLDIVTPCISSCVGVCDNIICAWLPNSITDLNWGVQTNLLPYNKPNLNCLLYQHCQKYRV